MQGKVLSLFLALKYATPFEIRVESTAKDYATPDRSELGHVEPNQGLSPNNVKSAHK